MRRKWTFFLLTTALPLASYAASLDCKKQCELPNNLSDSSGLSYSDGLLWTLNDHDGSHTIYGIDPSNCAIKESIILQKTTHIDWETLTQDNKYFYIGNIGNNSGVRKNLSIYQVPKKTKKPVVNVFAYYYPDQKDFTEHLLSNNFDAEALIHKDNQLYVFTKRWRDFQTAIYAIDKVKKRPAAKKITTLATGGLITDADYQKPDLWLLGYIPWFFDLKPFVLHYRWQGEAVPVKIERYSTPFHGQTEGMTLAPQQKLYITNEKGFGHTASLYRCRIPPSP